MRNITADETVNKFFFSEYVRNREGWAEVSARETQARVYALSVPQDQEKFAGQRRATNPNSPIVNYQNGEVISAAVRGITFINVRASPSP